MKLHRGKFDVADRMFFSINQSWESALVNMTDVKELIPEFYIPSASQFLMNGLALDLGERHNKTRVNHVDLPAWATSPDDFISKMRAALESDHVSQQLHHWIDLIFGYKQRGEAARVADNVFYHITYEGAVDIEAESDPLIRNGLQRQIQEFGQTPKQLFIEPHPRKFALKNPIPVPSVNPTARAVASSTATPSSAVEWDVSLAKALRPVVTGTPSKIHRSGVTNLVVNNDGEKLLSVAQDGLLKMHSLANASQLRSFNVGELALSAVCPSDDDTSVYLSCWDNHIYSYSIDYGRVTQKFRAHDEAVTCMKYEKSCKMLVSGSWDSSVKVWACASSGVNIVPLNDFYEADTEVKCLDTQLTKGICVAGCLDGRVYLFDTRSNRCVHKMSVHRAEVTGVALINNGRQLATSSADGCVKVFEMGGGELLSINVGIPVRAMKTDGIHAFVGDSHGNIRLLALETDRSSQQMWTQRVHRGPISCLEIVKCGEQLFAGTEDGCLVRMVQGSASQAFESTDKVETARPVPAVGGVTSDRRESSKRVGETKSMDRKPEIAPSSDSRKHGAPAVVAVKSFSSWDDFTS